MKVGVIGCGNVGLHTLMAFQVRGHEVLGCDPSEAARAALGRAAGPEAVATAIAGLDGCAVVFICVPTDPDGVTGGADLSIFEAVVSEISGLESSGWHVGLLVQRSTCPPGTARRMSARLQTTSYAVNPSFLSKSRKWEDSTLPPRLAFGGSDEAVELLSRLYRDFDGPVFISRQFEAVELLKYIENTMDAVLISLWNEYLGISDAIGIDRREFVGIADALGDRARFASTVRAPGGSFSLWCLPKDLAALIVESKRHGSQHGVLSGAHDTNAHIEKMLGKNTLPTSRLLEVGPDGRVRLAEPARHLLELPVKGPVHDG